SQRETDVAKANCGLVKDSLKQSEAIRLERMKERIFIAEDCKAELEEEEDAVLRAQFDQARKADKMNALQT
ncbi:MAG: hypothetical protein V2I33_20885, partial [Kangiellaceae bacterium]|nr:hypothetical protein [Kangiellaceae bacterium]